VDNIFIPTTPSCNYYDDSDDSDGDCFIADCCVRIRARARVAALRQFRDQYLERTGLGRAFIRLYYRHSPPVAASSPSTNGCGSWCGCC